MEEFIKEVIGEDYDSFVAFCKKAERPVAFNYQSENPTKFDLEALRQFAIKFRKDSELEMNYILYVCNHCDKLHVILEVNDPKQGYEEFEEDEE